jgi:hypothetical protein
LRNIDPDGLADVDVIIMVGLMAQFKEKACNYAVRRIAMDAFGISPKDNPDVWTILNTGSGTANEIYNKLEEDQNQGIKSVFLEVDEATAQELANEGNLVIAVQKNPFGSGHVAVVSPETIFTKTVADSTAFVKGGKGAKKEGALILNVGLGGGSKNYIQYRNWVFNKKYEVKYYVWRKDIKKYHKKESAKIKEKGREQKE